jgi:ribose transport system permease protein
MPVAFWFTVLLAIALWGFRFTTWGQGMMAVGHTSARPPCRGCRSRRSRSLPSGCRASLRSRRDRGHLDRWGRLVHGPRQRPAVPAIAAALVGGTAITGGICNPINVIFGAMFIALIPVATNALGVSPLAQSIVYGLVLVVAVAATMGQSRSGFVK